MPDFLLWLYAHYIGPQLKDIPQGDYSFHFQLVENNLPPSVFSSLRKREEFIAIHAFLLGLRTGAGLSAAATKTTSPPGATQP